jgi:hypothetical protein
VLVEHLNVREHLENLGVDVANEIALEDIRWENVSLNHLAPHRDLGRNFVKTVMKL